MSPTFGVSSDPLQKQMGSSSKGPSKMFAPGGRNPAPPDPMQDPNASSEGGMGSAATGYVTAQELPPEKRQCSDCKYFDGQSACSNPSVQADPEVNGQVQPDGCCNLIETASAGSQESDNDDPGAIAQSPEDSSSAFA